jgi:hypothetical protein
VVSNGILSFKQHLLDIIIPLISLWASEGSKVCMTKGEVLRRRVDATEDLTLRRKNNVRHFFPPLLKKSMRERRRLTQG